MRECRGIFVGVWDAFFEDRWFFKHKCCFKIAVGGVFVFDWFKIRMRICWCTLRNWTWWEESTLSPEQWYKQNLRQCLPKYLDVLEVVGKNNKYSPNGGLNGDLPW